jgi:hypothetical protein
MLQSSKATSRELALSPALGLGEWASTIDPYCDRIDRCENLVEAPAAIHHHHRNSSSFSVRIRITLADTQSVADNQSEPDLSAVAREPFPAFRQRLQDQVRVRVVRGMAASTSVSIFSIALRI